MDRAARTPGLTIRFYRRPGDAPDATGPVLPPGCRFASWRPARDGLPPPGAHRAENLAWFAFDRLGLFASRDFEALLVVEDGRLLHRLIITPRWFRFPFMGEGDLQVGALWTAPEARRLGLARAAVLEAHRRHAAPGRTLWFVVDEANAASIRLAEVCGYLLAGEGRRTRPLGLGGLGQFRLESATAQPAP